MKLLFCIPVALGIHVGAAASEWFTVVGDPRRSNADSVEVDPTNLAAVGNLKLVKVRTNRATLRTNPRGVKFRSFEATVEIDCDQLTARYVRTQFYSEPLWKAPIDMIDYGASEESPMVFRGVEPNPAKRIIKAACS